MHALLALEAGPRAESLHRLRTSRRKVMTRDQRMARLRRWVRLLEHGFTAKEIAAHEGITHQAVDLSLRKECLPTNVIEAVRAKTARDMGGKACIQRAIEVQHATR